MADAFSAGVQLFSQSVFSPPADSAELVAACPTIDLIAASGGGNAVYVRRRGGEVVSKLSERNKKVQAVAWKADGKYLAIAWSDGVVRLVGLESPKAVHQIRLLVAEPSTVTFISWSKNLVGMPESWQGSVLKNLADGNSKAVLDLPRTLMFLEVEDDLPKLPPLPVSGGSGDDMFVFSTRTSLEFMFPALKPSEGGAIHIMVLGSNDGAIHVCIYDTFVMGTFEVPVPLSSGATPEAQRPLLRLRGHASHPASSTHSLLLSNEDDDANAVYLIPMDFSFIFSSPLNLSLLDYKATTFQKLLRYVKQTQIHMQGEWQAARELPSRFLAGIQEDLQQELRFKTIDHALRTAALTGYVPPTLKLWLVETIAERGHKRWDKAVVSGLENLRGLIHENMMPALDRATLALTRLHGLAEFHGDDDIGFTGDQILRLIDMLSCLIVASHNALALVTAELELFVAFSAWMRSLIERLAMPAQAEEQVEKDPPMSVTPVLDYVTNHLLSSPLELHFGKVATADWEADWKEIEGSSENLMDKFEAELEKVDSIGAEDGLSLMPKNGSRGRDGRTPSGKNNTADRQKNQQQPEDSGLRTNEPAGEETGRGNPEAQGEASVKYMKAFPTFGFLTKLLSTHADQTLKDIAESGRRHVHFGPLTRLNIGAPVKRAEVTMTAVLKTDLEESADALTFTAVTSDEHPRNFRLFRTAITTSGGISTSASTQACAFALSGDGSIADIRFLGTDLVLVLWTWAAHDRPPRLIVTPLQTPGFQYENYSEDAPELQTIQLDHDTVQEGSGLAAGGLCWVADLGSAASAGQILQMEVLGPRDSNSSSGVPARVSLLYADGATYRTFALPPVADMFDGTSA